MSIKTYLYILGIFSLASAKTVVTPLDQKKVHSAYEEGDFDVVSNELESYVRLYKGKNWLRDDSVFLYKHLAVINTASPETREKGKYYMISMLRIMPSAEILDMYVSEEVDRIFLRTRQEFLANMRMFGVDTTNLKIPSSPQTSNSGLSKMDLAIPSANANGTALQTKKSGSRWGWWTVGGLAVAAAGAVTFYALVDEGQTEKVNVIDVPAHK